MSKSFLSKIGSVILALAMVFQMAVPAYAAGGSEDFDRLSVVRDGNEEKVILVTEDGETDKNDEKPLYFAMGTEKDYLGKNLIGDDVSVEYTMDKRVDKVVFTVYKKGEKNEEGAYPLNAVKAAISPVEQVNDKSGRKYTVTLKTTGMEEGTYYIFADDASTGDGTKAQSGVVRFFLTNDLSKPDIDEIRYFVYIMYYAVLNREPEEEGLNHWIDALVKKETDGASLAENFVLGDEFINNEYFADDYYYASVLYWAFLNREGSDEELESWAKEMGSGKSRKEVLAGFVNSAEFKQFCTDRGIDPGEMKIEKKAVESPGVMKVDSSKADKKKIEEYVKRMYEKALGREGEADGIKYWINEIVSGENYDAATVAKIGFFESEEYKNKTKSDAEFITDAYWAFFDREPDEGGYKYWIKMLATGEYDRAGMIEVGFGHSEEFKNLLSDYGFVISE